MKITSVLYRVSDPLVSVRFGRSIELNGVLPTNQFDIGKVWVPMMHFCACPKHCKMYWLVGRRLGLCRLILEQPMIGNGGRWVLSISSAQWVLEIL